MRKKSSRMRCRYTERSKMNDGATVVLEFDNDDEDDEVDEVKMADGSR